MAPLSLFANLATWYILAFHIVKGCPVGLNSVNIELVSKGYFFIPPTLGGNEKDIEGGLGLCLGLEGLLGPDKVLTKKKKGPLARH